MKAVYRLNPSILGKMFLAKKHFMQQNILITYTYREAQNNDNKEQSWAWT